MRAFNDQEDDVATGLPDDVVQRHHGWLVRLIVSRTGSQRLVEDVLQEIGLAVARSARRPEREEELRPWLCTITIRQCALALRKTQRRQRLLDGVVANSVDSVSRLDDPAFWLLNRERADLVREALAAMGEAKRTLLIWKYVDGMTYNELANRLRVPAHVVEYRVVTARRSLRRLLVERGLGEEDLP